MDQLKIIAGNHKNNKFNDFFRWEYVDSNYKDRQKYHGKFSDNLGGKLA